MQNLQLKPQLLVPVLVAVLVVVAGGLALLLGSRGEDAGDTVGVAPSTATATPAASSTATGTPPATPAPRPTSTVPPTIAPDGRTRDDAINRAIELLLRSDAGAIASNVPLEGTRFCADGQRQTLPADRWSAAFTAGPRSLYAVVLAHPNQVPAAEQYIVVSGTYDAARAPWRFALQSGRVVGVEVGCNTPVASYVPSVAGGYDQFLVLPPREDLPKPPATHAFSTRTGNAEVDAVIAAVQRRHLDSLHAEVMVPQFPCANATPNSPSPPPAVRCPDGSAPGTPVPAFLDLGCAGRAPTSNAAPRLNWAMHPTTQLHSVARIPAGYSPPADYLVIFITEERPYRWEASGLYVRGGGIVAEATACGAPEALYPPRALLVPMPPFGEAAPAGPRRTGVAGLDRIIEAMESRNVDALVATTDFERVTCVARQDGIGAPPLCNSGEPEGTSVQVVMVAGCEGSYVRREAAAGAYRLLLDQPLRVYAVADRGEGESRYSFGRGRYDLIFERAVPADAKPGMSGGLAVNATEVGVTTFRTGCGPSGPRGLLSPAREPNWLLAPAR